MDILDGDRSDSKCRLLLMPSDITATQLCITQRPDEPKDSIVTKQTNRCLCNEALSGGIFCLLPLDGCFPKSLRFWSDSVTV